MIYSELTFIDCFSLTLYCKLLSALRIGCWYMDQWLLQKDFQVFFIYIVGSEIWWNVYTHVLPMILLIIDFGMNRRNFYFNWKDTFVFYYFIALPINLRNYTFNSVYSHISKPVYLFLTYKNTMDYISVLLVGGAIILVHFFCYHFLKGWKRKQK